MDVLADASRPLLATGGAGASEVFVWDLNRPGLCCFMEQLKESLDVCVCVCVCECVCVRTCVDPSRRAHIVLIGTAMIPGATTEPKDRVAGLAWNVHAPHVLAVTGPVRQADLVRTISLSHRVDS